MASRLAGFILSISVGFTQLSISQGKLPPRPVSQEVLTPHTFTGAVHPSRGAEGLPWLRGQWTNLTSGLSGADKPPVRSTEASCLRGGRSPNMNWAPCALIYLRFWEPDSGELTPERAAQCAKQVPGRRSCHPCTLPVLGRDSPAMHTSSFKLLWCFLSMCSLVDEARREGNIFSYYSLFKKINYFYDRKKIRK